MADNTILFASPEKALLELMFLLAQTTPDYDFLSKRCGVNNLYEFKQATTELLKRIDLKNKQKDFEHLLFNKANSARILRFGEFVDSLTDPKEPYPDNQS